METKEVITVEDFVQVLYKFFTGSGLAIAQTIAILIFGLLAVKLLLMLAKKMLIRAKVEKTVSSFAMSIVGVALYFALFLGVGKSAGISTGSFIAIISAAGLALSLALKDSLSNLANGFIIVGSKPFVVGDYVEINGVGGTVQSIGIFNTKLVTPDNKVITLPNSVVIGNNVVNYSTNPTRRLDIPVSVAYDTDIEKAKKIMTDTARGFSEVLTSPPAAAYITEYKESAVILSLRVWLPAETYWDVKFSLNEKILKAFSENGIEISYNKLDVIVRDKKEA